MSSVFRIAAERLGLTINPPNAGYFSLFEIAGNVGGHMVRVRRDPMLRVLSTEVYLQVALDLGLHVTPAGQPSYPPAPPALYRSIGKLLGRVFGEPDMHIGDRAIDDAFDVHGDEEARVAPVLEASRGALLAWYASGVAFDLDDAHVSLRRYSSLTTGETPDDICADVAATLNLVRRVETAVPSLPPATALAPHVPAFKSLAEQHRLTMTATPLAVWGALRGADFWAHATRVGPAAFELEMGSVWQDRSRGLAGALRTATGGRAGDPSFEGLLSAEGDLAARLPADARQELLALARAGHTVSLGDGGLHLKAPLAAEPYPLDRAAEQAAAVVQATARLLQPRAAYRA
jgi:hypothetical protein